MAQVAEVWPALIRVLRPLSSACWRWSEVLTGQPRITPRTSEHFVPQMVNLDLIGGVSFKKGCYPGQEVVARSHYLGKLKRRMFAGTLAADSPLPAPGDDVIAGSGSDPCGEVVLAAQAPGGGVVVLFESQIAEAAGARIGETHLIPITLPYAVPCA
jgi:folate-binding protein YgfZ